MLNKLRAWWNKDAEVTAVEETKMTAHERDVAQEDYEGRKDDSGGGGYARQAPGHYEADSEKPRY
jgi:hypothetical protein